MPLSQSERNAIVRAAVEKTKEEFAREVATKTRLTTGEVLALGEDEGERKALAAVLSEVTKATAANAKKAAAIRNIKGGVEALIKIARLVV